MYENTPKNKVTFCTAASYETFDLKSRMLEYDWAPYGLACVL